MLPEAPRDVCHHRNQLLSNEMNSASIVTCGVCGSVYERRTVWISSRDAGEKRCEVCGELLEAWNGPKLPIFKLVKRGNRHQ